MRAVFLDYDSLGPADIDASALTRLLPDCVFFGATLPAQRAARVAAAEVVFVNKVTLDADTLAAAPSLQLVCVAATGTDNVDLQAARASGIAVCNIRDYCTPSVVQHVFSLLLALNQRLPAYRTRVQAGDWSAAGQFCLVQPAFAELRGKTLGVVGLGTLGSAVAAAGRAFGLLPLAARRPYRLDDEFYLVDIGATAVPRIGFGALLARADYLSLHCPLTEQTRSLIDAHSLAKLKPGAILLNTARGGLVDPVALLAALEGGRLGGAGIDVLAGEPPPPDHPLLTARRDDLIVTPHQAWGTREARQRALNELAANVAAYQQGERRNRVV